jgi:hypothetical protein
VRLRFGAFLVCLVLTVVVIPGSALGRALPHRVTKSISRSHHAVKRTRCPAGRRGAACRVKLAARAVRAGAAAATRRRSTPRESAPRAPSPARPAPGSSVPVVSSSGSGAAQTLPSTPAPTPTPAPTTASTTAPTTTPTSALAPVTTPPSTGSAPVATPAAHVETWAYDDCGNGGVGASAGLVRAWVSYAESNCGPAGDAKTLADCHSGGQVFCDVVAYLDTNWIYPGSSPEWSLFAGAASESWFQHAGGARVSTTAFGGGYLLNQADAGVRSFFQSYVRANYSGVDGLMMDDQSAGLSAQLYSSTCGCSGDAEMSSDAAVDAAHSAMSAAMTRNDGQPFLQVDNTLPPNPYLPQGFDLVNDATGVSGLIAEGEPEDDGRLDPFYSTLLDQIAHVAGTAHGFVVPLSYGQAGAAYQPQSRRVQEATILLGYSPGHLVDWAELEQGSGDLQVWPEEGLYPTDPVQSMAVPGGSGCLTGGGQVCSTGGHNDLQVAPGVYRREFGACYDRGTSIGPCAAIVNTTTSPVTVKTAWLTNSYTHQITFTGGDVQTGGTINLTGTPFTPGTTRVRPRDAVLLAG